MAKAATAEAIVAMAATAELAVAKADEAAVAKSVTVAEKFAGPAYGLKMALGVVIVVLFCCPCFYFCRRLSYCCCSCSCYGNYRYFFNSFTALILWFLMLQPCLLL